VGFTVREDVDFDCDVIRGACGRVSFYFNEQAGEVVVEVLAALIICPIPGILFPRDVGRVQNFLKSTFDTLAYSVLGGEEIYRGERLIIYLPPTKVRGSAKNY
jgi:hypothetical protein